MKSYHALLRMDMDEATWAELLAVTRQSMERLMRPTVQAYLQRLEVEWVAGGVKPAWMDAGEWADMQVRVTARQAANDDVP